MLTIYKASAGSGKTYTLAYEYIKALLGVKTESGDYVLASTANMKGHRHRHILAITFTNKATEEMKSRIIRELHAIASCSPSAQYTEKLLAEFKCDATRLAQTAGLALRQLLFDFNFFNVSTIDSFFQTVLRTFAREVDKPGNFEVELNDRFAVAMGTSMMLSDLNTSLTPEATPVGKWVKQFMEDKMEKGEAFDIFNRRSGLHSTMVSFIGRMDHEDFKERWPKVREYLSDPSCIDSFRKSMLRIIGMNDAAIASRARDFRDSVSNLGYNPADVFESSLNARVDKWISAPPATGDFDTKGVQALLTGDTSKSFKAQWKKAYPGSADLFNDSIVALFVDARRWATARKIYSLILDGIYYLGLMGYAMGYIDEYRRDNNLILLSDTNQLLKTIIGDTDTPFIYERLGVDLHHFMIDEFQDTSRMQWDILYPLVANSHSEGFDNLIIGDEKQSIYRFRNADPSLLKEKIASVFHPHIERGNLPAENTNYRSCPVIVEFNNALYSAISADHGIDTYANVIQQVNEKKSAFGGCVRVEVGKWSGKDARTEYVLPRVAEEILDMHARGYRFADIAVLVRTRDEAERVVEYLTTSCRGRISVMSDESLLLVSCASVRLVISMLRLIQDVRRPSLPDKDKKSAYATPDQVRLILNRMEFHLNSGLDVADATARVSAGPDEIEELAQYIDSRKSSTLLTLLENVIQTVVLPEEVREHDKAYLTALRDYVADYCSRHTGDLHSFLRWWDVNSSRLTIPGSDDIDAVRVMTIHKSKGLEMQCVICPFMDYVMYKPGEAAWYEPEKPIPGVPEELMPPLLSISGCKELADAEVSPVAARYKANTLAQTVDALNTTYVATTRAVSEMIIFATDTAASDGNNISRWIIDALPSLGVAPEESESGVLTYRYGVPCRHHDSSAGSDTGSVIAEEPAKVDSVFREDTQDFTRIPDDADLEYDDDPVRDNEVGSREAIDRGVVLHHVLSLVHKAPDLEHAFERVAHARRLAPEIREEYHAILVRSFKDSESHPLLSGWFHTFTRCLTERPIYLPGADTTLRPDRIVWLPDGRIHLIDYKFTHSPVAAHVHKIKEYRTLLSRMGYHDVEAYLWYPLIGEIKEVPQ